MVEKLETIDDLNAEIASLKQRNDDLIASNNNLIERERAAKDQVRRVRATLETIINGL